MGILKIMVVHNSMGISYVPIWIDSKPIVWDSSAVFTDNSD